MNSLRAGSGGRVPRVRSSRSGDHADTEVCVSHTMLSGEQRRGRVRILFAVGATSAVVAALAIPGGAVSAKPLRAETSGLYLVQLAGDPLASYAGGVAGIPGTKPAAGQKLN